MIILYMFCASSGVKYSARIMQSVNIHIIKIFNKTCRWLIKILDLICTFAKLFFLVFLFFFFLLSPSPLVKQRTPLWEVLRPWKWLHFSSKYCIHNSSPTVCNSFAFSKAQFVMKWCVNSNLTTAHPNDNMVKISPGAEEISALNMESACRGASSM